MILAFALIAQLLDLATYRPWNEANPIVRALGPEQAIPAKLWLLVLVASVYVLLTVTRKYRRVGEFVALVGLAVACVGLGSNLAAGL